jgi:GT2 family glycosyltransferase
MIDVIVPVYRGVRETRRCIDSVLASTSREPFELVVVDDASPEPDIAAWLDDLAARGRIELARNATNAGFVRSVNRGMALHGDRDVVLLNCDTEVANDWLDRLRASVYAEPDVGTATPFSNNATICSYPFEGWAGGTPGNLGLAALDRLFATTNAQQRVDLPTAVGFCMYIRRACLDAVGPFDEERFGRGYGEENDFSLRAQRRGWRNVLAADVFVYHEGAVSFSDERARLTQSAGEALLRVHPDYLEKVHAFIARAPLDPLRIAIDKARAATGIDEALHVVAEGAGCRERLAQQCATLATDVQACAATIAKLEEGLAHAAGLLQQRNDEIGKLRAGLSHAEALAFARAEELERIRGHRLWRYLSRAARQKS